MNEQQPIYESRTSMVFAFVTAIGFSLACLIAGAIVLLGNLLK